MGVSGPDQLFLSEKDLTTMDINFLVRPMLEFHQNESRIAPLDEDCDDLLIQNHEEEDEDEVQVQKQAEDKESEKKYKFMVSSLNLKLQSPREFRFDDDDQNDGLRTPTSYSDHKIPVVLECPPAPRKPRSLPSKRKASCQRVLVLLDLSKEIESMFPPNIVGNKIKKLRQES